jgi:hypothetical protein
MLSTERRNLIPTRVVSAGELKCFDQGFTVACSTVPGSIVMQYNWYYKLPGSIATDMISIRPLKQMCVCSFGIPMILSYVQLALYSYEISIKDCPCIQMFVQTTCPTCLSHQPHVRTIRIYPSIFKHIQIYLR